MSGAVLSQEGRVMPYRAGVGPGLGVEPRPPGYYCDQCDRRTDVTPQSRPGQPWAWFLKGKMPPNWKRIGGRELCPWCQPRARKDEP